MPMPFARTRRGMLAAGLALALGPALGRAQARREFVDSGGRRVVLPERVARVFAAGPPASVLAFAVAPDKLLGWTSPFRDHERPYVAPKYADLPTLGRLTGRGNTANVEVVLRAKPDLIVDYGALSPTYVSLADRVQGQTGIPYLLIDGSFDRMPDAIRDMGRITGETARAESLARHAADTVADIDARVARIASAERPRVYYGRGPRGLDTGLAGSINVESIERVGARNVGAELGRGGLSQVSIEQVLAWNPDTILTIDPNFYAAVWRDPLWHGVAAVRAKRVFLAPNAPFSWIDFPPSLNRLVGLRWLARVLYPRAFSEDLRPIVRDWYARLYHQTPTEAQLDALLASVRSSGT